MVARRKKSHPCPCQELDTGHPACSLVSVQTELSQIFTILKIELSQLFALLKIISYHICMRLHYFRYYLATTFKNR
jgi:hypothetical protein